MRGFWHVLLCAGLSLAPTGALLADGHTPVSIEARDRGLREVIAALAKQAKVEVKLRPEVRGTITTTITKTPFEKALSVVCGAQGLSWRLVNGVYHVGRFSAAPDDAKQVTEKVVLRVFAPRALARAFGHLDLQSLNEHGASLDLRSLLPPGLSAPPKPLPDGLEVSGTRAAVADFRFLVQQLEEGRALLRYRALLAEVDQKVLDNLPVYWAKGQMHFGDSPGREALYSAGDFGKAEAMLRDGAEGVRVIGRPALVVAAMDTGVISLEATPGAFQELRVAGRIEASLGLRLWAKLTYRPAGDAKATPIEAIINGGPLPPEEGAMLVSRPKTGEPGPIILLLIVPTVEAPAR